MAARGESCRTKFNFTDSNLSAESYQMLDAAPYTTLELLVTSIIIIASIVGIVANLTEIFVLLRNFSKWDNYQHYFPGGHLMCLSIADVLFLLATLIFVMGPLLNSPVSYDSYYPHFWVLTGFMLIVQMVAAGCTSLIAIETYKDSPFPSAFKIKSMVFIGVLAVTCLFCAVHFTAFSDDTTTCVVWPQTAAYDDYPNIIKPAPWKFFLSFRFILFHDVPVFYIPTAIIIYCYWMVIQKMSTDHDAETVSNLRARMIVQVVCHAIRIINFVGAFHFDSKGIQLLSEYTVTSEIVVLFFQGLLFLQPALNPSIYFLARKTVRPLILEAIGQRSHEQ